MRRLRQVSGLLLVVGLATPAAAQLELTTDHRSLFFGLMRLGEEKILSDAGSYHNEVTCSSSGGATWYLKVNLLQPLSAGAEELPLDALQWQLTHTDGTGSVIATGQFRPFTLSPDLVYISGPGESAGRSVRFQFRYSLRVPDTAVSGTYYATIRYTLSEIL